MNQPGRAKAPNGAATERVKISLTVPQRVQLEQIAAEHGLSIAEIVRQVMGAWLVKRSL